MVNKFSSYIRFGVLLYNKQLLSALELVLYEFDANKKCQVSLVVKYRMTTPFAS